jgi:uracil-DNA glycosylase family 4
MIKLEDFKKLYMEIYGSRIETFNFDQPDIPLNKNGHVYKKKSDENYKCNLCQSDGMQDIPFYKSLNNIKWMVIAETPGNKKEKENHYCLNSVFGWFNRFEDKVSSKYFSYITNFLGIKESELYITDAVKCFTSSKSKNGIGLNTAFKNCKHYLQKEIELLKPQHIIWLPSSISLLKHKNENKPFNIFFENILKNNPDPSLLEINHYFHPHFSNQNLSKIPVVQRIFQEAGKIKNQTQSNSGDTLIEISNKIYSFLGNMKKRT